MELLDREVTAKIVVPSEDELLALYAEAERAGELKPGATYERFQTHMLGLAKQRNTAERRNDYLHELMLAAGVRKDPDELGLNRLTVRSGTAFPAQGADKPVVTIVEFTDFASPFCAQANATIRQVLDVYGAVVKVVFRQKPKADDQGARKASEAALCANEQKRYWDYRQQLFTNQSRFSTDALIGYASTLGLEPKAFTECLNSGRMSASVSADSAEAAALKLDGSPEFVANGIRFSGAPPFKDFAHLVDDERMLLRPRKGGAG